MGEAMQEVPKDHPMRAAWEAYKATEDYANSRHWALRIAPMIQGGTPETKAREQVCDLMPIEQRTQHVEGSMWAAFSAGWEAAQAANQ